MSSHGKNRSRVSAGEAWRGIGSVNFPANGCASIHPMAGSTDPVPPRWELAELAELAELFPPADWPAAFHDASRRSRPSLDVFHPAGVISVALHRTGLSMPGRDCLAHCRQCLAKQSG